MARSKQTTTQALMLADHAIREAMRFLQHHGDCDKHYEFEPGGAAVIVKPCSCGLDTEIAQACAAALTAISHELGWAS